MIRQSLLSTAFRFVRAVLLWEAAVLLITFVVSYAIGWRTAPQYASAVVWAGFITVGIGFMAFWGGAGHTQGAHYHYAHSAGGTIEEHIRQTKKDKEAGYSFFTVMTVLGILSIIIGAILEHYVG